jgi:hypothetical protein
MKLKILALLLTVLIVMTGCHKDGHEDSSSDNNDTNSTDSNSTNTDTNTTVSRFSTISTGGDTVRIDGTTNLQWVASSKGYTETAAATTESSDISGAKAYCSTITFSGNNDWRVPTSLENAAFVKAMETEKLVPYYKTATIPRLIGVDGNRSKAINTHNSIPTGNISTWTTLLSESSTSYATKCVRP